MLGGMLLRTLVASLILLSFPAAAQAGTAAVGISSATYQANASEVNNLDVRNLVNGKYEFQEANGKVVPGNGCVQVLGGEGADCTLPDPVEALVILDDRDDIVFSWLAGKVGLH